MLPGRKPGFRAGFRPDSNRENLKIGRPAGRMPAVGTIVSLIRLKSDPETRCPAGSTIVQHKLIGGLVVWRHREPPSIEIQWLWGDAEPLKER